MKRRFICFKAGIDTGLPYGRVDVVGVRNAPDVVTYERQFICPECAEKLLTIQEKRSGAGFPNTGASLEKQFRRNVKALAQAPDVLFVQLAFAA